MNLSVRRMLHVSGACPAGQLRLAGTFDNGESSVADLPKMVRRCSAAAPLRDPTTAARFGPDDGPSVVRPCGVDVASERLYELVTGKAPAWAET